MTQDEVMEIVIQAHRKLVTEVCVGHMGQLNPWEIELLKIFAKLVAEKEREACAKVCDELSKKHSWEGCYANECAEEIRARGQQ